MQTPVWIRSKRQTDALCGEILISLAGLFLAALACGLPGGIPARAGDNSLYVEWTSGQDVDTCGTRANPCRSISYVLNHRAGNHDTILVAQGTYTENLTIDKGVMLMGGYEPLDWTRNIALYETIVDGNQARSVVMFKTGSDEAVLDGFTITGGVAEVGGGISIEEASPTIISSTITGNTAAIAGGGIYVRNGSPWITGNTITANTTDHGGGGIEAHRSSARIEDNIISHNLCDTGGGIRSWGSDSSTIEGNTVTGNRANDGGGILVGNGSSPVIKNNTVISNTSFWGGGIHVVWHSAPTIEGNTISNNSADEHGGGICIAIDSSPIVSDNTLSGNWSTWGAAISIYHESSPSLQSNTFSDNIAWQGAGIYVWDNSSPRVTGNVFQHNSAEGSGGAMWTGYTSPVLDQQGNPLPQPDTMNTYTGNVPDDLYEEPEPPPEPPPVAGRELRVPEDYTTIQAAINAAQDWDTVIVAPGIYRENINFNGKNITVRSVAPEDPTTVQTTIIDGRQLGRVVTFKSRETGAAMLAGFTIRNGSTTENGGGILCSDHSRPTISNNIITSNSADRGGGISCWNSAATIISNTIIANMAAGAGAGISAEHASSATIRGNSIRENTTVGFGAGIFNQHSSPVIEGNDIVSNTASGGMGPGIYIGSYSPLIIGNTIAYNVSQESGADEGAGSGGAIASDMYSSPIIEDNIIRRNRVGGHGGALYLEFGFPEVRNNLIEWNVARIGGGISSPLYSSGLIEYNAIIHNEADHAGGLAIMSFSSPTISRNTISGNAARVGGGISSSIYSSGLIEYNTITRNEADDGGGLAIMDFSSPAISRNTISGNVAHISGGAIFVKTESAPTIDGNSIVCNQANAMGGGIAVLEGGAPVISNNMVEGNAADLGGGIGGSDSAFEIRNTTITGNSSQRGGDGIYCGPCRAVITNTILWGNSGNDLAVDGPSSVAITYSDVEQGWIGEGNISDDPLFAGEEDYHLRFGSPCIDTGADAGLTTDFEGDFRPFDGDGDGIGRDDMGADEWVGTILHSHVPLLLKPFGSTGRNENRYRVWHSTRLFPDG